jgi:uncharacterized membrane protein YgcG
MCLNGCKHGVVSTYIAAVYGRPTDAGGGIAGLHRELPLFCKGVQAQYACYHGIGHALLWPSMPATLDNFTRGLLSLADMISVCQTLQQPSWCRGGAYMQLFHNKMGALAEEIGPGVAAVWAYRDKVSHMMNRLCLSAPVPAQDSVKWCAATAGEGVAFEVAHNETIALQLCKIAFGPGNEAGVGYPPLSALLKTCVDEASGEIQLEVRQRELPRPKGCQLPNATSLLSPLSPESGVTGAGGDSGGGDGGGSSSSSSSDGGDGSDGAAAADADADAAPSPAAGPSSPAIESSVSSSSSAPHTATNNPNIGFDNQSDTEWGHRSDYGITSMEIRMAAGIGLLLISMILGACVCACKIAIADGMGCFTRQRRYDRVVVIDGDSSSSSSHDDEDDEDDDSYGNDGDEGIEMTQN